MACFGWIPCVPFIRMAAAPTFFDSVATFLGFSEPRAPANAPEMVVNTVPPRAPRKPLTPADASIAEMTASIKDTVRELTREMRKMRRSEDGKIRQIKEAVEAGQTDRAHRIAQTMVEGYRAQMRLERAVARMESMQGRMQTMRANSSVGVYFAQSLKILETLNAFVQPVQIEQLAQRMAEESEKFNISQETMEAALDELDEADAEALGGDADGSLSSELIVEQIAADCGLALSDIMPNVPAKVPAKAPAPPTVSEQGKQAEKDSVADDDDDLAVRMRRLQEKKNK